MSVRQHDATVLFGPNCLLGFVAGMIHDVCKDCEKHAVAVCKAVEWGHRDWIGLEMSICQGWCTWTSTLVGSLQLPMLLVMLLVLQSQRADPSEAGSSGRWQVGLAHNTSSADCVRLLNSRRRVGATQVTPSSCCSAQSQR